MFIGLYFQLALFIVQVPACRAWMGSFNCVIEILKETLVLIWTAINCMWLLSYSNISITVYELLASLIFDNWTTKINCDTVVQYIILCPLNLYLIHYSLSSLSVLDSLFSVLFISTWFIILYPLYQYLIHYSLSSLSVLDLLFSILSISTWFIILCPLYQYLICYSLSSLSVLDLLFSILSISTWFVILYPLYQYLIYYSLSSISTILLFSVLD